MRSVLEKVAQQIFTKFSIHGHDYLVFFDGSVEVWGENGSVGPMPLSLFLDESVLTDDLGISSVVLLRERLQLMKHEKGAC